MSFGSQLVVNVAVQFCTHPRHTLLQNEATTFAGVGFAIPRKVLELGSYERQASSRTPRELALTVHGQPALRTAR
jgi:hypothetical protein